MEAHTRVKGAKRWLHLLQETEAAVLLEVHTSSSIIKYTGISFHGNNVQQHFPKRQQTAPLMWINVHLYP